MIRPHLAHVSFWDRPLWKGRIVLHHTNIFQQGLPQDAHDIRKAVFVDEQGFNGEMEFDGIDPTAHHVVLYLDGKPAATGRVFPSESPEMYTIGRVAVYPQYRKHHLGQEVLGLLEQKAKTLGAKKIGLSAQCQARGFYEKSGYQASGDVYLDEFCPHIHMEKKL